MQVPTVLVMVCGALVASLLVACSAAEDSLARAQNTGLGALTGVIRLSGGRLAEPTIVENTTDPDVCGRQHTLQDLVVGPGRGIRHVIVALVDVPESRIPPVVGERLILDNKGCQFVPHVSVATAGVVIEATNSDPVLHTTHLYGAMEANLALPMAGLRVSRVVEESGMVVVKCDVHGWMQAFVRIDRHPFHAVTDATGAFRIENLPPGDYTLESWHERLGRVRRTIHVEPEQTTTVSLIYDYR